MNGSIVPYGKYQISKRGIRIKYNFIQKVKIDGHIQKSEKKNPNNNENMRLMSHNGIKSRLVPLTNWLK